ncbi:MAG: TM2 domain-containing protein [Cyclonatronaceae bacterium]
MKKILLLAVVTLSLSSVYQAEANHRYSIDEAAIDDLFASSQQVDPMSAFNGAFGMTALQEADHGKEPALAFALAWVLGPLGVHRFYLGTATMTGVGYILTLGGCGIVATIDWVMLLVELIEEKNFENYVNNPRFFMWTN